MKDLVSIIVPVYNAEKSLERCIYSIMNQTYENLEIIVVNDGSTDSSQEILDRLAKEDGRLHAIKIENQGVSNARNVGLYYAKGRFVQFVDSDDFMDRLMTEKLVNAINVQNVDWVVQGYYEHVKNEEKKVSYKSKRISGVQEISGNIIDFYRSGILYTLWNKLYIRELIKEPFCSSISVGEDLIFNIAYIENIRSMFIDSDCGYHYILAFSQSNLSGKFHENAVQYMNLQFIKLLNCCKDIQSDGITLLGDTYLRDFTRILRKASYVKASKEVKSSLVDDACDFVNDNLDGYIPSNIRNKLILTQLQKRNYRILSLMGALINVVFNLLKG